MHGCGGEIWKSSRHMWSVPTSAVDGDSVVSSSADSFFKMEKELTQGLLELPERPKKANGEFLAINVEEDIEEEKTFLGENDDKIAKMVPNVLQSKWQTEKEANSGGSTSATAEVANSIKEKISMYTTRDSTPICIYKVPAKLKKVNEAAYTPRSVSIGPIHHGRPELQEMERYKWRLLDRYLEKSPVSLNFLVQTAIDMENQVRQCYQEPFDNLSRKEFSEMIMLDGIFLTVLLQEKERLKREDPKAFDPTPIIQVSEEHVVTKPKFPSSSSSVSISTNYWVRSDIVHDLMLLENQLPLFVLQNFHKYMGGHPQQLGESISNFFSEVGNVGKFQGIENPSTARHLVDFIRAYYQPYRHPRSRGKTVYNHSATELQEAGVIFLGVPGLNIFKIEFHESKLRIPRLLIDEQTETLFRNLIAFEQCQINERKYITSYVIFMDSLINTTEDVDLLVGCGIIQNNLGDHESVASLFNNLHRETVRPDSDFHFEGLCTELNDYRSDYWHQWKAKWFRSKEVLRRDYFNTPWSTISVIAAVILLVLTMIQTICSIISIL